MDISASGNIYIERSHPAYPHVIDFLISCCEPVSRTSHVEQYRIDAASLSAASAEGTYSLKMIENVLSYFWLDENRELPIDLSRLRDLVLLVEGLSEGVPEGGGAEIGSAADAIPCTPPGHQNVRAAGRTASSTHEVLLPEWVRPLDLAGTFLSYLSKAASPLTASPSSSPADDGRTVLKVKVEQSTGGSAIKTNMLGSARCSGDASSMKARTRVLQLRQPAPSPALPPVPKPLISLAVVRRDLVSHRRLPEPVRLMMEEERSASRVQIVLQPRLRRFHQMTSGLSTGKTSHSTRYSKRPSGASALGGAVVGDTEQQQQQLFYYIQSHSREHLERVVPVLKEFLVPAMLHGVTRWIVSDVDIVVEASTGESERLLRDAERPNVLRRLFEDGDCLDQKGDASSVSSPGAKSRLVYRCEVKDGQLKEVKEGLFRHFGIRADCFYDYHQDQTLHVDNLSLAAHARLRPYQVASLERFRRGNTAHQGVIVLPCGAGKTLTGIGAAATMKKTTIVMCVNNMSVFQWQREFLRWTNLKEEEVTVCTAKVKQRPGKVFITTYSMVIAKRGQSDGAAAEESRAILQTMTSQPWGLLLLDEVHTALAHHFQEVLNTIKYKCVLGLSATLLREDDKIGDLRHLVGPKLYEANWLDLTRAGFLASVECAEVQCPMPSAFLEEYMKVQRTRALLGSRGRGKLQPSGSGGWLDEGIEDDGAGGTKRSSTRQWRTNGSLSTRAIHLASCNPYKLWCAQALLAFHQQRSPPDKVILFCDYIADVRFYAFHLNIPFMDQRTSEAERTNLLQHFQFSTEVNAIILTRVGDVALDLPCASVIIQISGLGASRRQEAQRLGRILRPKPPSLDNTCSYFYTLVSQDTGDIQTSYKRQSWLRDQGFAYRVLHCHRVLEAFLRVGGLPCCVGPRQWWYQYRIAEIKDSESEKHTATASTTMVAEGSVWQAFSPTAAALLERMFLRGKEGCTLTSSVLGSNMIHPSPAELGGYPLQPQESWTVVFSSVDAPRTVGTVRIGEGPLEEVTPEAGCLNSGAVNPSCSSRLRRIRRGCLDERHRCMAEDGPPGGTHGSWAKDVCIRFALNTALGGQLSNATGCGSEADGAGVSELSWDDDDDDGEEAFSNDELQ